MNHLFNFSDFLTESTTITASDRKHYAGVKDLDVERPRMAPAPKTDGLNASRGSSYFDLYLQDEASHVMIDKYGLERGKNNWEGTIDQGGGVMFAASAKIANEKYKMLTDLDELSDYGHDYFKESYFSIWKRWKKKTTGKDTPDTVKKAEVKKAEPVAAPAAKVPSKAKVKDEELPNGFEDKDVMRIQGIIERARGNDGKELALARQMALSIDSVKKAAARGRAADDVNAHDIADIFYARAKELRRQQS